MHRVGAVLAALELSLSAGKDEPDRHVLMLSHLAGSEEPRKGASRGERAARRYPSPRSLRDAFPSCREDAVDPRARQKRDEPASYEADCRIARARLFAHAAYRNGAAFESALVEAMCKRAGYLDEDEVVLDAQDYAVLDPPAWHEAQAVGMVRPRRWLPTGNH